ncbi:hypothetical protein D9M71_410630 [compost metagenome]
MLDHLRVDHLGRVGEEDRQHAEAQVEAGTGHRGAGGDVLGLGRHHPRIHVLLRDGAEHHGHRGAEEGDDILGRGAMEEGELAFGGGMADHGRGAAGHVTDQPGQVEEADDDDHHLQEVGHRHRPHATEQGVQQDDEGADHHALGGRQGAVGQHAEHHAQGRELRRDPAEVGGDDHQAGEQLHVRAEALAEEVADGQQIEAIEGTGEHQAHQHQASERSEGVFDDPGEAFLEEGGGNAQHGLGAEPGGEHHGHDQGEGHAPAAGGEVRGVLHPGGSVETDSDGD